MTSIMRYDDNFENFDNSIDVGDLNASFKEMQNLLTVLRMERSQMYVTLAAMLLDAGVQPGDSIVIGSLSEIKAIGSKYYCSFNANEAKELTLTLRTLDEEK
jgi:hypothetical protein